MDMMEKYAEFCTMMLEDRIYEDPEVSFADLCRAMGVRPRSLDAILIRELGLSGEEILHEF